MANKSNMTAFTADWERTAAWAQSQGIKQTSYLPVYQMDAARVLAGQSPMSTSERTRAILAAHNPNNVTPVPSDHPSPWSFFGNAVNDLRNIFTGLEPQHLVSNLYHQVETAIVHPESWIKPLAEVGSGIITGDTAEIKQGLEGAGQSILSLAPGVWDLSQLASGGVNALLEHPVSSFIDAVPNAPIGDLVKGAVGAERAATMAKALGLKSADQLRGLSVGGGLKSFVKTRPLSTVEDDMFNIGRANPTFWSKLAPSHPLTDSTGQPQTVGAAMDSWIENHSGGARMAASMARSAMNINSAGTEADLFLVQPAAMAVSRVTPEQVSYLTKVIERKDPATRGKSIAQVKSDLMGQNPKMAYALDKMEDVRAWAADEAVTVPGTVQASMRSDGSTGFWEAEGDPQAIVDGKAAQKGLYGLMEAMGPGHHMTQEAIKWDQDAERLIRETESTLPAFDQAVENLQGGTKFPVVDERGKVKTHILNTQEQARVLAGHDGRIQAVLDLAKSALGFNADGSLRKGGLSGQWIDVAEKAAAIERRLSKEGPHSLNAELDPAFMQTRAQMHNLAEWARKRANNERQFAKEIGFHTGAKHVPTALKAFLRAQRKYEQSVWLHPPGDMIPLFREQLIARLMDNQPKWNEHVRDLVRQLDEKGYTSDEIARLQEDPHRMAEIIYAQYDAALGTPPGYPSIIEPAEHDVLVRDALEETEKLRVEGYHPIWVPHISELDKRDRNVGRYDIHLSTTGKAGRLSMGKKRTQHLVGETHDILAAVHLSAKEALQREATIRFVTDHLAPHLVTGGEMKGWVEREFPERVVESTLGEDFKDTLSLGARDLGYVKFVPEATFGFTLPRWTSEENLFLPKSMANVLPKLLDKGQFPLEGVWNKETNLFRFAILGLSPRYTAHIVFGGFFFLALRSSGRLPFMLGKALKMARDGDVPREALGKPAEWGVEDVQNRTFTPPKTPDQWRNLSSQVIHEAGGHQMGELTKQDNVVNRQGIQLKDATPWHMAKAAADVNIRFTNWMVNLYRSWAYVDYLSTHEGKMFTDPATGERVAMTHARAEKEAIRHSLKVMGDLKSMTPFERSVMTKIMPFYGWTRHVLAYVGTFPVDHPFRAQFLTVLANQNSDSVAAGLDKRIQFLFFLGSPDQYGNVSAIDTRFMDPLRDVANYATLSGWMSSLNPAFEIPLVWQFGSQAVYGSSSLYPNVTFDSFYGIETAGSQGNALNAVEQVVPQVQAIDEALGLSAYYRQLARSNPQALSQKIFQSLNIPFAQVQHLNLKQMAAKNELARYQVNKQLATTAFNTGDYSAVQNLPSIVDPVSYASEYNTTPSANEALYAQLQAAYPGLPPSETAVPPPAPLL